MKTNGKTSKRCLNGTKAKQSNKTSKEVRSKIKEMKGKMENGEQAYVVNEFRRKSIRAIASGIKL